MELRATAFPDLFNVVDENGKGFAHVMKAKDGAAEVGAMWSAWLWLPDSDEPMGTAGSAVTAMLLVDTKREHAVMAQESGTLNPVTVRGGRGWRFNHKDVEYLITSYNGHSDVQLYWRYPNATEWVFRYERNTNGFGARGVAQEIHRSVTSS